MRRRGVGWAAQWHSELSSLIGRGHLALVNVRGYRLASEAGHEGGQTVPVRFFWRLVEAMHMTVVGQKILVLLQIVDLDGGVIVVRSFRILVARVLSLGHFHGLHVVFRVMKLRVVKGSGYGDLSVVADEQLIIDDTDVI